MSRSQIKFEKLEKALLSLEAIYLKPMQDDRSNVDATIQRFEFTFELAWKFLKDYFFERDIALNYPKEIIQEAFTVNLINNETIWIKMLRDRNMTSHTYNEKLADEIFSRMKLYVPELRDLLNKVKENEKDH
jgi:nucleotidyltransferase substrate binding protein (TIGR01987 family)